MEFIYDWKLSDLDRVQKNNLKVFSCFSCGGGSTMGYKMAGCTVLGNVEIDPRVNECYVENHKPKYNYCEDIREFRLRDNLPKELFNLDILDGSPPCSSFSMAGNREKDWGKKKKFREGQQEQTLDDLFFEFIALAKRLQPKIVIAENVKGIIQGSAVKYVTQIRKDFEEAGYDLRIDLLNASKMGVPQRRERVFFIAVRKDLSKMIKCPFMGTMKLNLKFNEKEIPIKEFITTQNKTEKQNYSDLRFGDVMCNINKSCNTIATINRYWINKTELLDDNSLKLIGSYPTDYNFLKQSPQYLIGMSVPPLMTYKIMQRILKDFKEIL